MHFGVLGPLAVTTDDGEPVTVPGTKVRALLADLLAHRNQVVSADLLIEDLWGDDAPANAAGALQVRVSQLRKALNDAEPGARDLVESRRPGYVLRTGSVDADRFAELAAATDVDRLSAALALWRGEPYADVADAEYVRAETTRLTEQRLAVLERRAEARLGRGEHDLVAGDLAELVAQHPLREGLRALHVRALYAAGRQSEALSSYAQLHDRLADELGLDPGPELVALRQLVLNQDAGLSAPPKTARIRNSLPAQLDELVGRAEALAELRGVLPQRRLVTLVGPGGVGKTRLATEAAREQTFTDEAHLVELTVLAPGADDVAELVLASLDIHESAGTSASPGDRLVAALGPRRLLLVLDNCEHVVEPVATLVARLMRDAPDVTVLATSREPLGLTGELLWEVPPLPVPADGRDLDGVRRSAAARLFAARAGALQRGFRLDARTAPAVAELCRRLDGLPLALELAATRVRSLGVEEVAARLDDRFALLTSPQRDRAPRQRTLTAVIGWSWDLLENRDREVLARLAVFSDGCTFAAAEAVAAADLDGLARLVDRSLLVLDASGCTPRYRLLESVAAFGLDRLEGVAEVRARHATYFTELAEQADPHLRGPEQGPWLDRLDAESANLRVALAHGGGLRLANALTWYGFLRGRLSEVRHSLSLDGDAASRARADAWRTGFELLQGLPVVPLDITRVLDAHPDCRVAWFVASALIDRSQLELASGLLERALDSGIRSGDRWVEAAVLSSRAKLAHISGDLAALERDAVGSAELFAEIGDRWGRLQAADWVGGLADLTGDHERAAVLHREGLSWAEELGLWPEVAGQLSWLAWLAVQTQDHAAAHDLAGRAYRLAAEQDSAGVRLFAELGLAVAARRDGRLELATRHLQNLRETAALEEPAPVYLPMVLVELGHAAELAGDATAALALHVEAFDAAVAMGAPLDAIGALEGMAAATPDSAVAARLLGAALAARSTGGLTAAPTDRDQVARVTARLTAALGGDRVDALMRDGRDLSPDEARAQV